MTMMQKLQAKRSKKGFTLVELVIVIAILAILAAIAIPTIISTIDSANRSSLESNGATIEMQVKAAINEAEANTGTVYNGKTIGADTVRVLDILVTNSTPIDQKDLAKGKYALNIDSKGNVTVVEATTTINLKGSSIAADGSFTATNDADIAKSQTEAATAATTAPTTP